MSDDPWADFPEAAPSGGVAADQWGQFPQAPQAPDAAPDRPADNVIYRSQIFPLTRTDQGVVLDWSSGIPGSISRAVTLPGRVMSGEVPMPPLGSTNPADYSGIIPETTNFAMTFAPGARAGATMLGRKTPTAAELMATGGRQMDQFETLPVLYNPSSISQLATTIQDRLLKAGVSRNDAKGIYGNLDEMWQLGQPQAAGTNWSVGPANLHSLRRSFGNKFGVQGEHQLAPAIAQEELDRFIGQPPEGSVLAGPLAATFGGDLFGRARGNLAAGYRGSDLDALKREIDLRTAAANSGRNLDNTTRSKITSVLLDPDRTRGFTSAEETALEGAVYGDKTTNRLRDTSKRLGGGGGLGATAVGTAAGAVGSYFGIPPWVAYPLGQAIPSSVGKTLGQWGAARTQAALDAVNEATRRRSPLFNEQPPQPMQVPDAAARDAITRALMMRTRPPQQPLPQLEYDPNRA